MTDDWNANDPDATRVHYDLAAWTFDQQAELASELADASVPHAWEGTELIVPEDYEGQTDAIIAQVEERLNILELPMPGHHRGPRALDPEEPNTEYDLAEWPPADRRAITDALVDGDIAHRWEGPDDTVLVIGRSDEDVVDRLLDAVEEGEITASQLDDSAVEEGDDDEPLEALTTFFLAGERLHRNPTHPDGLAELIAAIEMSDPARPPFGVERRLWERACALAGEISDALIAGESPDTELAQEAAAELHDLLRPYV